MDDSERLLIGLPLLARLNHDDLRALAEMGAIRKHGAGATIFRQGDAGDAMHVIVDGSVRVSVVAADGREATVALLGPGECLGELALLDGRPRSGSATASEATRTMVVSRDNFRNWLSHRPRAALELLETMSIRFRRKEDFLLDMVFMNLAQRLAKRLLDLVGTNLGAERDAGAAGMKLRITQEQLASILGASRQAVSVELNAFARAGWISLGRAWIRVDDPAALRSQALGDPLI
jgi:CRP-like cAMP-binding protein